MKSATTGFTLIEILVVLLIVSVGVSLVGPRLIETHNQIKAGAEERKLGDLLEAVRMKAFSRQVPLTIEFKGHRLCLKNRKDLLVVFNYLSFMPATITFNGNGFPDINILRYQIRGREKVINVFE